MAAKPKTKTQIKRAKIKADVKDYKQMAKDINAVAKEVLPTALNRALGRAGMVIVRGAKLRCPVKTGILRNSIAHSIDTSEPDSIAVYVGTNVEYAPYVEIGTGIYSSMGNGRKDAWVYKDAQGKSHITNGSKPYPFLKPARDENLSAIYKCFEEII